uniref:Uncharacterized protein n=1 Tax=Rhizophora mucronata TaxID=61149 RepID=A0A2P2M7W7_RHIMU
MPIANWKNKKEKKEKKRFRMNILQQLRHKTQICTECQFFQCQKLCSGAFFLFS